MRKLSEEPPPGVLVVGVSHFVHPKTLILDRLEDAQKWPKNQANTFSDALAILKKKCRLTPANLFRSWQHVHDMLQGPQVTPRVEFIRLWAGCWLYVLIGTILRHKTQRRTGWFWDIKPTGMTQPASFYTHSDEASTQPASVVSINH